MGRTMIQAARRQLPTGASLPEEVWRRRHHGILILLWLHSVALFVFGLFKGFPVIHMLMEASVIAISAAIAGLQSFTPRVRMVAATFGLVSCSAILVHLSGGVIEMHFHFFVIVAVITLYQSWLPFLVAIGYVVVHHGLAGAIAPSSVFNHPSAIAHPWRWAAIHGAFVLAESAACLTAWRLTEIEGERADSFDRKLSMLVQSSHDAIISLTRTGHISTWNPAAESLFGYATREALGQAFGSMLAPAELGSIEALLMETLETGWMHEFETKAIRKNGSSLDVSVATSAIHESDGSAVGFSVTVRDIAVQKAAEREREASTSAMRDFVAIASHELRTPITVIKGMSMTLRDRWQAIPTEMKEQQLDAIIRNSRILAGLVDDLLVVSKIESGSMDGQPVMVNVATMCLQVIDDMEEVDFDLRIPDDLEISIDPSHLDRMLINYIRNARAYGAPPYRIDASGNNGSIEIAVVDHGQGVPADFEPRLFEKFARANKQQSQAKGGSGLGLSIVRGLARAAGGDAWYERVDDSESRFYVGFPGRLRSDESNDLGRGRG